MRKTLAVLAIAPIVLAGCSGTGETPTGVQPADAAEGATKPKEKIPVKIVAKKAAFKPSVLNEGGKYTCARATVTNQTTKNLDVNPLYFALTSTDGEKKKAELGQAEGEFDTTTLAPGEKASGLVCAEGAFAIKHVAFAKDGFGTSYRAEVA